MELHSLEAVGFPGYHISADGTIWSEWGSGNQNRPASMGHPLHERKPSIGSHGYKNLYLKDSSGKNRMVLVHHLVGRVFLGDPPEWHKEYRHLDGDKLNCRASNIAWGTRSDNAADRSRHGTHRVGSRVKNSKLTEEIVAEIRQRIANGETHQKIADYFGVSRTVITRANARRTWAHVA